MDKLEAANWEIYSGSGGALPAGKFFVTFDTPVPSQWAGESDPETIVSTYFDISYDTGTNAYRITPKDTGDYLAFPLYETGTTNPIESIQLTANIFVKSTDGKYDNVKVLAKGKQILNEK